MNHLSIHEHIFLSNIRIHTDGVFVDDFHNGKLLAFSASLVHDERVARGVKVGCMKVREVKSVRRDICRTLAERISRINAGVWQELYYCRSGG